MNIIEETEVFYRQFNGEKGVYGYSYEGRPLYYFVVGDKSKKKMIVQCCIHAREFVTSYLCLKLVDYYSKKELPFVVYFLPMTNPDGVERVLNGNVNYKANANGVDLNTNFDARFGTGKYNVRIKGDANYIGRYPFSEEETIALRDFTNKIVPDATISYHAKGEEIYFDFFQKGARYYRDLRLANIIAECTGYTVVTNLDSSGGYKDWCVEELKIPAFTIEVGSDKLPHPLNKQNSEKIFFENKDVIQRVMEQL